MADSRFPCQMPEERVVKNYCFPCLKIQTWGTQSYRFVRHGPPARPDLLVRCGPPADPELARLFSQQVKIDFVIAVFKEDCLAPIATLRHMMRKPGDHDTRQSSHTEDHSTTRRGIGIMSPYFQEVGFGPKQDMTKTELVENKSVPGQVEERNPAAKTLDSVTINVTTDQAKAANTTIADRTANPGNYQVVGNSCVNFGEQVIKSAGAPAPNATLPSALVSDIRSQQYHDNTTQTPTPH
jgi:hypothetical protein